MIERTHKLTKIGNSFGFIIPKALIDYRVLECGQEYKIKIQPLEKNKDEKRLHKGAVV